jgi:hypothetical protein
VAERRAEKPDKLLIATFELRAVFASSWVTTRKPPRGAQVARLHFPRSEAVGRPKAGHASKRKAAR